VGTESAGSRAAVILARLAGATAMALMLASAFPVSGYGQAIDAVSQSDGQMLLEADTLIYDNDSGLVTAAGNVRIDYGGTRLVAHRVTFNRNTSRLVAFGDVEIVDLEGNHTFADEIDVTDDLREGFVNALRIETADRTFFAAESAERRDGNVTTFNTGVYTACEPCEENPDKPPLWRIKATRIIWNGKEKTIRFISPRLELFGLPIAYFPALEIPDHTVKRKTGFLFPNLRFGSGLGTGLSIPYYWALSPSHDLTTTITGFTQQGFLTEVEWRQRFNNGAYSIQAAGIYQLQPGAFGASTVDRRQTLRGMIGTKGRFDINPRWAFGWNVLVQSDKNFSRTYSIPGFNEATHRSEIYLTGLNDRNYFNLSAYRFQVQERTAEVRLNEVQPWVLPSFDYAYTARISPLPGQPRRPTDLNILGVEGATGRLTAEAEWRRSFITPGGLMLSPLLALRGDAIYASLSPATTTAIANTTIAGTPVASDIRAAYFRYMATAGLEARWPILFSTASASHVLEPVGQIFARPDAPFRSTLGIPNEDAQSMVFDATTLFERDKFSGYDALEGGVRANVGVRYSGSFSNGWTANAIAGQSYHIAGLNSFGAPDLVNAGAFSGLETATSDYVGLVGVTSPNGLSLSAGGRFDETTLEARRIDVRAGSKIGPVSFTGSYAFIQKQPLYGDRRDRHQLTLSTSAQVHEYWRVFGSGTYDFEANRLMRNSIGFAYDDECFSFTFTASQTRNRAGTRTETSFGVNFSLRTLGDFGTSSRGL
jgi:LPS-assembly protein